MNSNSDDYLTTTLTKMVRRGEIIRPERGFYELP